MDAVSQRKIDRYFGALICRFLSLFPCTRKPVKAPGRILVILISEMGSLVLGYTMFGRIREKYPDADLHVLLFKKNREVLDLLEIIPSENVITLDDSSLSKFVYDSLAAIHRLRSLSFDVVIDCELFSRVSSIFSFLSGAPLRAGFHPHTMEGLYRGRFINRPVLYNTYRHISDQFLALVESIDSQTFPPNKVCQNANASTEIPKLRLKDGELQAAETKLYRDFPSVKGKKLVLIYPSGGILPIRAWPLDYFCRTAKVILDRGFAVGIVGLESDKGLAGTIQDYCQDSSCIDLSGYTSTVRELLVLFHLSPLLISNDGGPGQLAAMTPIRTILFFGPETPDLYGPKSSNTKVFFKEIGCSPCLTAYNHRNSPCDGDNRCLSRITPDEVLECAFKMLADATRVS